MKIFVVINDWPYYIPCLFPFVSNPIMPFSKTSKKRVTIFNNKKDSLNNTIL